MCPYYVKYIQGYLQEGLVKYIQGYLQEGRNSKNEKLRKTAF